MNKKLIFCASVLTSVVCASVLVSLVGNKAFSKETLAECAHDGNHYAGRASLTEAGNKEFWTCCKCHKHFLEKPTGTWQDATLTESIESSDDRYIPAQTNMVSEIAALDDKGLAIQKTATEELKANFDLLSASDKALVTNSEKLVTLAAKQANNVVVVDAAAEGALAASYGDKYTITTVADADFGKVFNFANGTITEYGTFKMQAPKMETEGVGALGFYLKGDNVGVTEINLVTDFPNATQWSDSSEPYHRFYRQENDSSYADRGTWVKQWKDTIGAPNGWKLFMINLQLVEDVIDLIDTNGYFSFKTNGSTGSAFQMSSLFGLKNVGCYDGEIARKQSNGYPNFSGLTVNNTNKDWATLQSRYNDWGNSFKLYSFYNNGSSPVDGNGGFVITSTRIAASEDTYANLYFFIYLSVEMKINIGIGSSYYGETVYSAGWNRIDFKSADVTTFNGLASKNIIFCFKTAIPVGAYFSATPVYGTY